jgi:hypothetical protein
MGSRLLFLSVLCAQSFWSFGAWYRMSGSPLGGVEKVTEPERKGEKFWGTWERCLCSESSVVFLSACTISSSRALDKSSRWELESLVLPSLCGWHFRASPVLFSLARRCPSYACSSSGTFDESGHWELGSPVRPSLCEWFFRASPLPFKHFVCTFGVTEGAGAWSIKFLSQRWALLGREALVSWGFESGPCAGRAKRPLADELPPLPRVGEVKVSSPSSSWIGLLLPSLPISWRSQHLASRTLSATWWYSFNLGSLCSFELEQGFIIVAKELQRKHKEKRGRSYGGGRSLMHSQGTGLADLGPPEATLLKSTGDTHKNSKSIQHSSRLLSFLQDFQNSQNPWAGCSQM